MNLRIAIVDDEPLARELLAALLQREPDVEIVAQCGDGQMAANVINTMAPEVVLLDVQLSEQNGFEVLEHIQLGRNTAIIFVTAYDKYALQAFRVHAVDYLLKPVTQDSLHAALEYARMRLTGSDPASPPNIADLAKMVRERGNPTGRIQVRTGRATIYLKALEIDWVEAVGNFVCFHVGSEAHIARQTLQLAEKELKGYDFVRIHRTALVSIDRIRKVQPAKFGDFHVELRDGTRLPVGRRYKNDVLNRIKHA